MLEFLASDTYRVSSNDFSPGTYECISYFRLQYMARWSVYALAKWKHLSPRMMKRMNAVPIRKNVSAAYVLMLPERWFCRKCIEDCRLNVQPRPESSAPWKRKSAPGVPGVRTSPPDVISQETESESGNKNPFVHARYGSVYVHVALCMYSRQSSVPERFHSLQVRKGLWQPAGCGSRRQAVAGYSS